MCRKGDQEMKIQHFLLTRFNVRFKGFLKMAPWKGGDREYLEKRFDLFERYTLASIRRQNSDFKWLVFFSSLTPEPFRSRAMAYAEKCPQYEAVFVDDAVPLEPPSGREVFLSAVLDRLDEGTEYYIASRIDNDDAFNVDALNAIREAAERRLETECGGKFFLVMPHGATYDDTAGFTQTYDWDCNHFPTVVCGRNDPDQPFSTQHTKIRETGLPVVKVPLDHAWLEIVNGTNLVNSLRVRRCRPKFFSSARMREVFGIDVEMSRWRFCRYLISAYLPAKIANLVGGKSKRVK